MIISINDELWQVKKLKNSEKIKKHKGFVYLDVVCPNIAKKSKNPRTVLG